MSALLDAAATHLRSCLSGFILGGAVACATDTGAARGSTVLDVDPSAYDFSANPRLLSRIRGSAHGYFRFINPKFSEAVCRALAPTLSNAPAVNLHGDAHLEQYAVTDLGRGLTDFDDAAIGPAPIDLLRFGVSLTLANEARGWRAHTDALLSRFLEGYRGALRDPETEAPEPVVAERIRRRFKTDRPAYFDWIASVSRPLPAETRASLDEALGPYVEAMRAESPDLAPTFFAVGDIRRLTLGIGSALDDKFLVRVEGPTSAPNDDVILEVKEVRDHSGVSCVSSSPPQSAFRILVAQSRIAYRPYRFLGYIRYRGRTFWIHAWVDNYKEFELGQSARTPEELAEVVYDVGVQLGRGHPNQIAAPLDRQLRQALLSLIDKNEDRFREAVRRLSADVEAAWERFRAASDDR